MVNLLIIPRSWFSCCVRSQFGRGLLEQLLPLTQLLSQAVQPSSSAAASTDQLLLMLELMRSVLEQKWAEPEEGRGHLVSPQSRGRVLQALITEYFTLVKILAQSLKKGDRLENFWSDRFGESLSRVKVLEWGGEVESNLRY